MLKQARRIVGRYRLSLIESILYRLTLLFSGKFQEAADVPAEI